MVLSGIRNVFKMSMKHKIYVLLSLFLFAASASAQYKGRGGTARKQKVEVKVEDPRITQMLNAIQQVVFIDSMVVDADSYMNHIPLSIYSGKLTQVAGQGGAFTNEMGDRRLTTAVIDADTTIASSDFIANRWTEPQPVGGIGDDTAGGTCQSKNPFLMPDGVTLYFAQKSEKSIGGYDIFLTRYNSERGTFLKPENVGMPFASEANDLFFAIDEFNRLGYFVTDRRQPEGKVCIYVFIPTETRRTYHSEAYSSEQLRRLADIGRIADSWPADDQQRREAMARLENARSKGGMVQQATQGSQQSELDKLKHEAEVLEKALTLARNSYALASEAERQKMRDEILRSEQQLEKLQLDIRDKEKQIPYNN